ncbi:MAG: hypothetical protein KGH49_03285 [Candidatus Micrarchaeota archaeon]|nr:hypothetical protein [Candidatus Micrarchaeota archaeon]
MGLVKRKPELALLVNPTQREIEDKLQDFKAEKRTEGPEFSINSYTYFVNNLVEKSIASSAQQPINEVKYSTVIFTQESAEKVGTTSPTINYNSDITLGSTVRAPFEGTISEYYRLTGEQPSNNQDMDVIDKAVKFEVTTFLRNYTMPGAAGVQHDLYVVIRKGGD